MATYSPAQGLNPVDPATDLEQGHNGAALQRVETLSIDPALYEKLFLTPKTQVHGHLREMFGVPTPLALIGNGIALTPLSCALMGWRGADQQLMGASDIGAFFWFGGLIVIVSAILEFFLGNTFAFVLFGTYGAWFLTYAATLQPFYGAAALYAKTPGATLLATHQAGQMTPEYTASFGFILLFMAVISFIFLICTLRVNVVFFLVIFGITLGFSLLAAALFVESEALSALAAAQALQAAGGATADVLAHLVRAQDKKTLTLRLVTGGGGAYFGASMLSWFLTFAIMLAVVDFPFQLPVGDLSTAMRSRSQVIEEARKIAAARALKQK